MKKSFVPLVFILITLIILNVTEAVAVNSVRFIWHDEARNRTIPVKIFYPTKNSEEKLPIIVFSHGLGGSIDCCSYLAHAWASQGFAAVFLQHPGSDENIWKGKVLILSEFKESYRHNWNGRTRAEDIKFVLDNLEQLINDNENHPIAVKLDKNRIGVGGYDLGCLASLLVAGQIPSDNGDSLYDSRIKAVLAMSPPIRYIGKSFQEIYAPIDVPALFITGTEDDSIVGPTKANQRRIPFDAMSRNNRYLVTFQGSDHRIYGGRIFSLSARNDQRFQSAIIRVSNYFWKAVLQKEENAETVLNGYGFQTLLNGMATVERHIVTTETDTTEIVQPSNNTEEPETKKSKSVNELTDSVDKFPVTRLYRTVIRRYAGEL
jgi:pimeloyl-ACP methyl ester carboxylesterase